MTSDVAAMQLVALRGAGLTGTYKSPDLEGWPGMVRFIGDVNYRESQNYERALTGWELLRVFARRRMKLILREGRRFLKISTCIFISRSIHAVPRHLFLRSLLLVISVFLQDLYSLDIQYRTIREFLIMVSVMSFFFSIEARSLAQDCATGIGVRFIFLEEARMKNNTIF